MTEKFKNGAFVFSRARGVEPRRPEDVAPLLTKHGLSADIAPEYPGDRTCVGRAFNAAKAGMSREGLLLRPIQRTSSELVYGVVRETPDAADKSIEHKFQAVISWSTEPNPSEVSGDHVVAHRVAAAYRSTRGMLVADDWAGAVTAFLEDHNAARVRNDGRIYWVPPQEVNEVRRLAGFLAEIGIDLILCEIEPAAQTVAKDAAQGSLNDQLDRLQKEVAEFDGKQRPSTYTRRLEEFQKLKQRAILYRDALGCGAEQAEEVLGELQVKVEQMLELRTKIVVPRGTALAKPPVPTAPSDYVPEPAVTQKQESPSLRFAGADFKLADDGSEYNTLRFVSDDARAQEKIKMLEAMGIAGHDRWQKMGASQVCIANSGPVGEKISILVKLPDGQDIADSARSLAAIGIEVCCGENVER